MKILFPNRKRTSVRPRKRPASTERRNRGIRSPRPAETGTDGAGNRAGALFGRLLFDRQFAAIEAALGAYAVIERRRAAIRTSYDRRNDCLVMGSSLIPSGRRDFVFRMCHVLLLSYLLLFFLLCYYGSYYLIILFKYFFRCPSNKSLNKILFAPRSLLRT